MPPSVAPTSYSPVPGSLHCGSFEGRKLRHTVRADGGKDWLLIYTLRGSGIYQHAGGELHTAPHQITLFRRGAVQNYRHDPRHGWDIHYAHFVPRAEWVPWLDWPELSPGLMLLEVGTPALHRHIPARMREMIRLNYGNEERREALALNALEEVLLWCDSINPAKATPRLDHRLRRAMDYLTEHCAEAFSEGAVSKIAGLSPSRLRHLFRTQVGFSPRVFQEEERMRRAGILLAQSNQNISEISSELGFENPFYFSLRFKKHSGMCPRVFRERILRAKSPKSIGQKLLIEKKKPPHE